MVVTPEMVVRQIEKYNKTNDPMGHLYGAIMAPVRDNLKAKDTGKQGNDISIKLL